MKGIQTSRKRGLALGTILLLLFLSPMQLPAFDNKDLDAEPGSIKGGAHRLLNTIALEKFRQAALEDPVLKRYDFYPDKEKLGIKGLTSADDLTGEWTKGLFKVRGSDILSCGQTVADLDRIETPNSKTFSAWIIDGGFTADEPEKYMSWRHFYNPVEGKGQSYFTDLPTDENFTADKIESWKAAMGEPNPKTDAMIWALSHPDNPYSWKKGQDSLEKGIRGEKAGENFAKAWRSIGQTMHLLCDMTVPAHVRNDSHPAKGSWFADDMRADAYEFIMSSDLGIIGACKDGPVANPEISRAIEAAHIPSELFKAVARHVNSHFFSSDTVPFQTSSGKIKDLNWDGFVFDLPDFKAPKPEGGALKNFSVQDEMGSLIMYNQSWLDDNNWEDRPGILSRMAVESQAKRLIPIALKSCERLMELSIPRISIGEISFDKEKLSGTVARHDLLNGGSGNSTPHPDSELRMIVFSQVGEGGVIENFLLPPVPLKNGRFTLKMADLSRISNNISRFLNQGTPITIEIGLDLGGILVRSGRSGTEKPVQDDGDLMAALHKTTRIFADIRGNFQTLDTHEKKPPESKSHDCLDQANLDGMFCDTLKWEGNRFVFDRKLDKTKEVLHGRTRDTLVIHVEGEVDPVSKMIVSIRLSNKSANYFTDTHKGVQNAEWSKETSWTARNIPLEVCQPKRVSAGFCRTGQVPPEDFELLQTTSYKTADRYANSQGLSSGTGKTVLKDRNNLKIRIGFSSP